MKNVILFVTVIFTLTVLSSRTHSASLEYLPLSEPALLNWAVTSQPFSASVSIQTTNQFGGLNSPSIPPITEKFSSYDEFERYYTPKALQLYNLSGRPPPTQVRYRMTTRSGLRIDRTIGGTNVTLELLRSFKPKLHPVYLSVGDATNVMVQFGNEVATQIPFGTNGIMWSMPTTPGRIRLTLTMSDGKIVTYTQDGEMLKPAVLSSYKEELVSYYHYQHYGDGYGYNYEPRRWTEHRLSVLATPGADTFIQQTTNLVSWEIIGHIPWDYGYNYVVMLINSNTPSQFFRAYSE